MGPVGIYTIPIEGILNAIERTSHECNGVLSHRQIDFLFTEIRAKCICFCGNISLCHESYVHEDYTVVADASGVSSAIRPWNWGIGNFVDDFMFKEWGPN